MGKTDKKEYVSKSFKLRVDLAERLDKYSIETGVSRTFAVEKALEKYLAEVVSTNNFDISRRINDHR